MRLVGKMIKEQLHGTHTSKNYLFFPKLEISIESNEQKNH